MEDFEVRAMLPTPRMRSTVVSRFFGLLVWWKFLLMPTSFCQRPFLRPLGGEIIMRGPIGLQGSYRRHSSIPRGPMSLGP